MASKKEHETIVEIILSKEANVILCYFFKEMSHNKSEQKCMKPNFTDIQQTSINAIHSTQNYIKFNIFSNIFQVSLDQSY